ncbi:LCP family protein [[Clostridium] dakarense]|uniref:LCP family protein n=1 Tax=Faecalimicrobium dakarense TaxID=1301100 RepID=UPI0004BB1F5E|nr:LCP family protein [[Clostridium] dakarense]
MSNKILKRIVALLIILIIMIPASAFGFVYFKLNSMYDSGGDNSTTSKNDYKAEEGITNILLCGTDGRPGEKNSRSDAMMILTVDSKNKSLKLTSLARDTYVSTSGHGDVKLTEAYAYGGINLLAETIERNFELDIQNYAIVDFYSFMDIIDTLGGITIDVKQNEIKELNKFIPETYGWNTKDNKEPISYIQSAGEQKLNGYQALAYSRIRKGSSGGALERDKRQRQVIEGLMKGVKDLPMTKYPKLVDTILPYVKTNMKPAEILSVGGRVLKIGNFNITQMEFPIDDGVNSKNVRINNKSVMQFEPSSLDILHGFIFENIMPEKNK